MPFGFDGGSFLIVLALSFIAWAFPVMAVIWALVTLSRLRTGQQEILTRIAAIERRLGQ